MKVSETEETARSFCAIPLNEATRKLIICLQRELRDKLPGVRWSRPETLHLTLRFFGDIPLESLEKAAKVMLSVDGFGAPFELSLKDIGAFPSPTRPRVLWLGFGGRIFSSWAASTRVASGRKTENLARYR